MQFYTTAQSFSDGNLYGLSHKGGALDDGTFWKYTINGADTCTLTTLYENTVSTGGSIKNWGNANELSDGKVYIAMKKAPGTTSATGTVIRMDKDGSNIEILHQFKSTNLVNYTSGALSSAYSSSTIPTTSRYDGTYPEGFIVEGADGKIYGTCTKGGYCGVGTVWRMDKDGSNYEVILVLNNNYISNMKTITGTTVGVSGPNEAKGNIAQDENGYWYLHTWAGGSSSMGAIWRFDTDGDDIRLVVSGTSANGYQPYRGPIVVDSVLYGTFSSGGPEGIGTVYMYNINTNTYTVVNGFNNSSEGGYPNGSLAYDGEYLYGTCRSGGSATGQGGTLWKFKTDGTGFEIIHHFATSRVSTSPTPPPGFRCSSTTQGVNASFPSRERVTFSDVPLSCAKSCIENYDETSLSMYVLSLQIKSVNCTNELSWSIDNDSDVSYYEIEYSNDSKIFTTIAKIMTGSNNQFTHSQINETGYYRVKLNDKYGNVSYSHVEMSYSDCNSINLSVYPNPFYNTITIAGADLGSNVNIYNNLGQLVKTVIVNNSNTTIDLSTLSVGIYAVNVIKSGKVMVHKLSKNQ